MKRLVAVLALVLAAGWAGPAGAGLGLGQAFLDPADIGADTATCIAPGPEWRWTFALDTGIGIVDTYVIQFESAGELVAGAGGSLPTSVTVTTPGPDTLLGGWATYEPADLEPVPVLELVSVCAPEEPSTTTTTAGEVEVVPAAQPVSAAPAAPVKSAPAFTG